MSLGVASVPTAMATTEIREWLPVPPEDLALRDNPKQPGADAMILYREQADNAALAIFAEYIRIKIFTQAGTKAGHIEIPFVKGEQKVSYLEGRTIEPDGSVVNFDGQLLETTKIGVSGLKVLVKAFTLPDVRPGCIVEYRFRLQGVRNWSWSVSQPIYTRYARFTYIPAPVYGFEAPVSRRYNLRQDASVEAQRDGSFTMTVHDIPAIVEEPLMPPMNPLEARVEFSYQDARAPSPAGPPDKYWDYYGKAWSENLDRFIDKRKALEQEAARITAPGDPPETKLRKIYARVLQIRNLSFEDYKTRKETKSENLKTNNTAEDVLKRGFGSQSEINELFVGLARAAGFDATLVFVASRDKETHFRPSNNDVNQLTSDVVWVSAGGKEYYLDPAARYYPFEVLPWFETSAGGIKVSPNGGTMVSTPDPIASDATTIRKAELSVDASGSVAGTVEIDFIGQEAGLLRTETREEDEAGRTKELEEAIKSWLPEGASVEISKITDWNDVERPLHVEGTVKISSFGSNAIRHFLMPLEIFQATQANAFTSATRVNPIYFHFPYQEIDDLSFHCADGFAAESMPAAKKIDLGAVFYEISAAQRGDGIEVKRQLDVNKVLFGRELYAALRSFFGAVRTNDNAEMVLHNSTSAKNN